MSKFDIINKNFMDVMAFLLSFLFITCLLVTSIACFYLVKLSKVGSKKRRHISTRTVIQEEIPPSYDVLSSSNPVNSSNEIPPYVTC